MILHKILEYDLHRSRQATAVPHTVHTPAVAEHVPAVVSTSRGQFVVTRVLFLDGEDRYFHAKGEAPVIKSRGRVVAVSPDTRKLRLYLASNVFSHNSDHIDNVIGGLFDVAYKLSVDDGLGNVFGGPSARDKAFSHVQSSSGMKIQPHVCLVPDSWEPDEVSKFFGKDFDATSLRFRRFCRVVSSKATRPVFLSRPDMVGLYTQFMGGGASISLHNVALGMAFCR